jgi:hypothetical protein
MGINFLQISRGHASFHCTLFIRGRLSRSCFFALSGQSECSTLLEVEAEAIASRRMVTNEALMMQEYAVPQKGTAVSFM